jgi:hypothetical protein
MLIKLTSSTSGEVVMFAKHARRLFEIIGKECTARGVFTFEQLPAALARLYQAVDEEKLAAKLRASDERAGKSPPHDECHALDTLDAHEAYDSERDADDGELVIERKEKERVSLVQRAQPLIHLMEWTVKEQGFILWEASQDF